MISNTLRFFGYIAGGLSVASLIATALNVGIGPAARTVLRYYESFAEITLGWAEPFIQEKLDELHRLFDWNLHVHSYWKHLFVLLTIYFFRTAGTAFSIKRRGTAVFYACWGLIVALMTSIGTGVAPLNDGTQAMYLIGLSPIMGVALFDIGNHAWAATWLRREQAEYLSKPIKPWWEHFCSLLRLTIYKTATCLLVVAINAQLSFIQTLANSGIALFGIFVVSLGVWHLVRGAIMALTTQTDIEDWKSAFARSSSAQIGMSVFGVLGGAAIFFILNAGLARVGL